MTLGGAELFLSFTLVLIGAIENLRLYLNHADRIKQTKWSLTIYGIPIIVMICGLFTPPDILSNIIFSGPGSLVYIFVFRNLLLKRLIFSNSQKQF